MRHAQVFLPFRILLERFLDEVVVDEVLRDEIGREVIHERPVAGEDNLLEFLHDAFGRRRIGPTLEIDAALLPVHMFDRQRIIVIGRVIKDHRALDHCGIKRQIVLALLRKHLGCGLAVLAHVDLRRNDGIVYPLHPGRAGGIHDVSLVHHHHAARMSLPDITGEAQHLGAGLKLAQGVERFGDDVGVDLLRRDGRRHIGRRQHQEIALVGCQLRILRPNHRRDARLSQQHLGNDVVDRVPERHRQLLAAEILE